MTEKFTLDSQINIFHSYCAWHAVCHALMMTWNAGHVSCFVHGTWVILVRWMTCECNSHCFMVFFLHLVVVTSPAVLCIILPHDNSMKSPWIILSLVWEKRGKTSSSSRRKWWTRHSDECLWFTSPSDHKQLLLFSQIRWCCDVL